MSAAPISDAAAAAPAPATAPEGPAASRAGSRRKLVFAILGAVGVAYGAYYYASHRGMESTDDAQVDAEIVAVPARIGGLVAKVYFVDNQEVKAGALLADIDDETAKAKLAQAEANLAAGTATAEAAEADARVVETNAKGNKSVAQASLQGAASSAAATKEQIAEGEAQVASATASHQKAKTELERTQKLVASGSMPASQLEQAQATFDTSAAALAQSQAHLATLRAGTSQAWSRVQEADARLQQSSNVDLLGEQARARARAARAQVGTLKALRDLAALDVSYTKILAPRDGVVSKKTIGVGQMVTAGQPVAQLVPTQDVWVTGNFKETQLVKMHAGQAAHIEVDAFPGAKVEGELESFSGATGARFSLLPPDNATGNYTKVVQRVPVKVRLKKLPTGVSLRPGMSVELTIDTRN
ncbi:MAG: HlyD family secretion protein [Polyangiaceae bacterium]|nr:HlyD family secretion protein [Polyangiaceae bacterium]